MEQYIFLFFYATGILGLGVMVTLFVRRSLDELYLMNRKKDLEICELRNDIDMLKKKCEDNVSPDSTRKLPCEMKLLWVMSCRAPDHFGKMYRSADGNFSFRCDNCKHISINEHNGLCPAVDGSTMVPIMRK